MSGTSESQPFELDGTNIVGPSTNGYTFQNDVKLYLSVNGGAWQQSNAPIIGWNSSKFNLQSELTSVLPLARKPEASDHHPRRLFEHHDPDDRAAAKRAPDHHIRQSLELSDQLVDLDVQDSRHGFDYDTSMVYVNGVSTGFLAFATPVDGVIDVFVPAGLRSTPGIDSVVVKTKYGTSNALNLDIIGPPVITSVSPALISFVPQTPSLTARTTIVALPPTPTSSTTTSRPHQHGVTSGHHRRPPQPRTRPLSRRRCWAGNS